MTDRYQTGIVKVCYIREFTFANNKSKLTFEKTRHYFSVITDDIVNILLKKIHCFGNYAYVGLIRHKSFDYTLVTRRKALIVSF